METRRTRLTPVHHQHPPLQVITTSSYLLISEITSINSLSYSKSQRIGLNVVFMAPDNECRAILSPAKEGVSRRGLILMLHGWAQNAVVFKNKTKSLTKYVLVFLVVDLVRLLTPPEPLYTPANSIRRATIASFSKLHTFCLARAPFWWKVCRWK